MKRIVLVDDDPGIQDALTLIFSPAEYEMVVYPNGTPLLTAYAVIPDIYILDKQLSGIDGLDICKFLKQQPATMHLPVIMLSASPNIHRLAKAAYADDALEKPFRIKDLRDMVVRHLRE